MTQLWGTDPPPRTPPPRRHRPPSPLVAATAGHALTSLAANQLVTAFAVAAPLTIPLVYTAATLAFITGWATLATIDDHPAQTLALLAGAATGTILGAVLPDPRLTLAAWTAWAATAVHERHNRHL